LYNNEWSCYCNTPFDLVTGEVACMRHVTVHIAVIIYDDGLHIDVI